LVRGWKRGAARPAPLWSRSAGRLYAAPFRFVLTTAELAAITTPTIFIIGSDDPYLSIEQARRSIDHIHGARLYEVPGGHAPWLVDAHAAELIATHSRLATGPHLGPAPGESRPANAPT